MGIIILRDTVLKSPRKSSDSTSNDHHCFTPFLLPCVHSLFCLMIYQDQRPFYPAWGSWSYSWLEWPYFNLGEHGRAGYRNALLSWPQLTPQRQTSQRGGAAGLSWSQSGPEAPAGLGREISLMPPKEFILESGKRMSENALCYSLLIKLLFLKNMNSFFFWLNSACINWERNVTRCRGYYCALVIFKSLLIRVEFNFGIKKHCRWFYWIFMSMSQMSVFQMPFA